MLELKWKKKRKRKRTGGKVLKMNQNLVQKMIVLFLLQNPNLQELRNENILRECRVDYQSCYYRFKTLEQLLEEQNPEEDNKDVQPIVFTDHTGRKQTTRTLGESTVNRNAVGFEVVLVYIYHNR